MVSDAVTREVAVVPDCFEYLSLSEPPGHWALRALRLLERGPEIRSRHDGSWLKVISIFGGALRNLPSSTQRYRPISRFAGRFFR